MMKKLFSGGGNDKSSWLGKALHVGRYQCVIEEIIAEGGYALVFLVKSSHGQRYALKRVSVNEIKDLEMCKQEISILKMFTGHKNTIGYVDSTVNTLSPGIYEVLILMEYCKAGHVVQLMNECLQTGFTEKMVMKIFCDVCEAVALLHGNKPAIIHRDLKVENVLRKQTGDFVLCDYGSAHFGIIDPQVEGIQNVEDEIASCTTLAYRAPEMVDLYSGQKITVKADIWALGCLLYKLCFFTTPFGESVLAIQNGQFDFPETSRFSDNMYTLIKMMLHIDQSKRADIYHVANFAFNMIGKQCPIRSVQVKPAPIKQNQQKPKAAAPAKTVSELAESADGRPHSEPQQMGSAASTAAHQPQQQQPRSNQPVSTSLAPRQRPKGVAKFTATSDTTNPKPFKNEHAESHGQQQHVHGRANQPFDSQEKGQYQQHQLKQHQQQQQQHHFVQQPQLQNQQRFVQAQQQQQQQHAFHQQQQQQQQQQHMVRQQLLHQQQQAFEQQKQLYDQQRQAYDQQLQRKAYELQQQQQAYEQFQRQQQQQQQQIYMQQMMEQQKMAEYKILQRQHQQLQQRAREMEQQRHQDFVEQQRRGADLQMSKSEHEHQQHERADVRGTFESDQNLLITYQDNSNNIKPTVPTKKLQQQAREMELQRYQYFVEQQRRWADLQMSKSEHEHQQHEHQQHERADVRGTFESDQNLLITYQDNSNNIKPTVPTNPFDDNFAAGTDQDNAFTDEPKLNPFDNVFTTEATAIAPAVKDRSTNGKSHFRSRSDTFSDLARRVNSSDDDKSSDQILSVNDAGSPHKSSPDIRIEQFQISTKDSSIKEFSINGHPTKAHENVGKIDLQNFSDLYSNQQGHNKSGPKMQVDIRKPTIDNKSNMRTINSEPTFSTARETTKSYSESNNAKDEKPTLEEADESPLISPSTSVQERRYVYVRTSSCSSDEGSEKSKHDSSEDEVEGSDERLNYDEIGSSSSSLEADLENCGIETKEESVPNDDIFGSAPFNIEAKKHSAGKKHPASRHRHQRNQQKLRNDDFHLAPDFHAKETPPLHSLPSSGTTENRRDNPFGMDPFTVPAKSKPQKFEAAISNVELKVNENVLSRSPTSEDPFGHAPFLRIVKHKRPLSSQELAERKEGERRSHPRIHHRRRMLPKTPVQE